METPKGRKGFTVTEFVTSCSTCMGKEGGGFGTVTADDGNKAE